VIELPKAQTGGYSNEVILITNAKRAITIVDIIKIFTLISILNSLPL
jgi:hypothetical protein